MKRLFSITSFLLATLLFFGNAYAWHVRGKVYCDTGNGILDSTDIPLTNVKITVESTDPSYWFVNPTTTDSNGYYALFLADAPMCYKLTIDPTTLPEGAQFVTPTNPFSFCTTGGVLEVEVNWLISSPTCQTGACWMTAGGVKFDSLLGFNAAERGPRFNFGGNTFPGCSSTAGDGGQWSFVDRSKDIHFQAWVVNQVRCGNVSGIPPGSTSPVTPFNYIEFSGLGTVKPVAGGGTAKKAQVANSQEVYFFARFEDRNEPGNESALPDAGAKVDRLFLRVWTNNDNPMGSVIYLIDEDGDPATVNPVTITGGNIQIHISSCP